MSEAGRREARARAAGARPADARATDARETDLKKILVRALGRHKARTAATVVIIGASIALEVVPPLVLGQIVDDLGARVAPPLLLIMGYFCLLACSGAADAAREALIVAGGEGLTHALRSAMMAKLHRLPASYFTSHEAGETASIQVNDVDAVEDLFSSGLVSMISDLGTVIATLAVVFAKSLGLGILLAIALPALSLFTACVRKRMLSAHIANREATARASGILPESLHVMRSLHVFHAERFAEGRYGQAIQDGYRAIGRTNFYDAVYSPVILTASAVVIGLMMGLSGQSGAFRDLFGMSVGTAVALIAYVNNIFTPLSSIGMEIQTIQSAAAGWRRVQAFLDEQEAPASDGADGTPAAPTAAHASAAGEGGGEAGAAPAIELDGVAFAYEEGHPVLRHACLTVARGEFVTLAGRTGAGKSTLFKLLLGLYEPQAGTVRVEGASPCQIPAARRRQTICCVEQKATIVPGTIRDQVTLGDGAFDDGQVWRALEVAGLAGAVRAMPAGLDEPYAAASLSQGQRQLLMIARAIVSDPDILLLDEMTAGLDAATERLVVQALRKASSGRTVLSISHRLSQMMCAQGRVVSMDEVDPA